MEEKNNKSKKLLWIIGILLLIFLIVATCFFFYVNDYYKAKDTTWIISDETVSVTEISEGYFFDGPGEENALIFYPGAKVDEVAYSELLHRLAAEGVDCFLVKMPYHIAFFGINKAKNIINTYQYEGWYMAGHSLGGVAATIFVNDNMESFKGIVYLASYPTKNLAGSGLNVLSIYGSEDGVLNKQSYEDAKALLPADTVYICIEGGNHAMFGSYGSQKGDGEATIPAKKQLLETLGSIVSMINE